MGDVNEEPNDSGDSEEDGSEEEAVVVSELGDQGGGSDGGGGAGDLIEDVLEEGEVSRRATEYLQGSTYDSSVHPPQLRDVPADDITWSKEGDIRRHSREMKMSLHDTPDKFDHSVGYSTESPDKEDLRYSVSVGCGRKMSCDHVQH